MTPRSLVRKTLIEARCCMEPTTTGVEDSFVEAVGVVGTGSDSQCSHWATKVHHSLAFYHSQWQRVGWKRGRQTVAWA